MKLLEGKVAIITGASRGSGVAIASTLADSGCRLVLAARSLEGLMETARQIGGKEGYVLAVPTDVRNNSSCEALVDRALAEFGRLDILINNAGVMGSGPFHEGSPERWREMVDVNLSGLLCLSRAALAGMLQQGSGHVVNISSGAGRAGLPGTVAYGATKWGVVGMCRSLREEMWEGKTGIRVTCIEPGSVDTTPGRRYPNRISSQDVADAVLFAVTRPPHVNIDEIWLSRSLP